MTTRTSLNNLETLAASIARHTGKKYQVGRIYGLSWSFVEILPAGGRRHILTAGTKAALFDLMAAYFQGVRDE